MALLAFQRPRMHHRQKLLVMGLTCLVLLSACGSQNSSSASATTSGSRVSQTSGAASGTPYIVHAIVSETGAGSFLGAAEAKALQVLASQVNASGGIQGHPVKMEIENNETSPSLSVSLASPLVAAKVPFLLVGSLGQTDLPVDAMAGPNGPLVYDLTPVVHPKPGSMVFSAGTPSDFNTQAYLTFFKSKGWTRIAAITSTDANGVNGLTQLKAALALPKFSSIHLVANETFDPSASAVTTQLSVIKAAQPQALVVWTAGTPFGTVLQGISQLGMKSIPTLTTNANQVPAELEHLSNLLPQKLYFFTALLDIPHSQITNPAVRQQVVTFDQAVTAAGGVPSDAWALAWDPAQLLINAVKKLGVSATANQLLNYMQNLHNAPGLFADYNFSVNDHRGILPSDIYITIWNAKDKTFNTLVSGPGGTPLG